MNGTLAIVVPLGVALIAALGGWLVKARQLSGKIETSEAADLWAESAAIRADCWRQLELARERIAALEKRLNGLGRD